MNMPTGSPLETILLWQISIASILMDRKRMSFLGKQWRELFCTQIHDSGRLLMRRRRIDIAVFIALLGLASITYAQQQQPPATPPGVKVLRNLPYVENGHERQKLDLYLPEKENGLLPVVVWVHGGGWKGGNKDRCPAVRLVTEGFVVASINYRLSQHAKFPAQIEDCKAAIRWLRANANKYQLDPDRIGAWGASAGGHLVALLGTTGDKKELNTHGPNADQSSKVQAVCDWFGPTDFLHMVPLTSQPDNPVALLLGGPVQENKEKAARASPATYVAKGNPPFLIMHGDEDKLVPVAQSEEFADALKKVGGEVTLRIYHGAGHGGPAFTKPESLKLVEEFFVKHLKRQTR
jgi:acetyl esterase/lipase